MLAYADQRTRLGIDGDQRGHVVDARVIAAC